MSNLGTVEVNALKKEIKINCDCGNKFYVMGNIPHRTRCESCKREIGLRLALRTLNSKND